LLTDPDNADNHDAVWLTQRDVRELQLASGAIRTGIRLLVRRAGLRLEELQAVFIAGGFGSFIRRNHAQRIGLIPPEIQPHRLHFVGNTALAGAKWAVLSTDSRRQAEQIARRVEVVELAMEDDFQDEFAESMVFPSGAS
jgi:uncharacterized 2Fe-2S/4Fe-4S cluster protein (DUF4445 family)